MIEIPFIKQLGEVKNRVQLKLAADALSGRNRSNWTEQISLKLAGEKTHGQLTRR